MGLGALAFIEEIDTRKVEAVLRPLRVARLMNLPLAS
jgi:hypothetical protein